HLGRVEIERRHAGWRSRPDEALEVAVDDGVPELAAAQVHAADGVAGRAVAGDALLGIQLRAVGDVGVGILGVMQRRLSEKRGSENQRCCPHGWLIYTQPRGTLSSNSPGSGIHRFRPGYFTGLSLPCFFLNAR